MKDSKVVVAGAGLMGGGIAQTCAQAGYKVANIDFYAPTLDEAGSNIEKLFDRKTARGTATEGGKVEVMDRLTYSCDFGDVKSTGIMIEAVSKKMEIKKDIFRKVDELTDPDTVTMSNASALSISEIASATERADKVMGVHSFYPAPVTKLAELIRGIAVLDDTYGKVEAPAIDIKKEVANCPELSDFIVSRILMPMMNEAAFLVMEGCKPEGVDRAMKLGANHLMGPSELCDFVGVDTMPVTIIGSYNGFRDSRYRSCPILGSMMRVGYLGRRTEQGSYQCI